MLAKLLPPLTRQIPLMSGCGTLAHAKLPCPGGSREPRWMRLRTGERVFASAQDYVGRVVHYFGDLDPKVFWVARQFVKQGDAVIDLGANVGTFSLPASTLVGRNGSVHGWEPQPDLVKGLRKSRDANGLEQFVIQAEALGEEAAELELHVPEHNRGGASLLEGRDGSRSAIQVPVFPSGERFAELGLEDVRMVKMDVEGFETQVVRGAFDFWKAHPPEVVLFEYREDEPFKGSELATMLEELGYRIYCLPSYIFRPVLLPLDEKPEGLRTSHDLVALRK